ncbi:hypothetical protein NQ315_006765 [Exocentrus adspersus]|uniref:PWWP domain-containing protein n=1 Tax=Exocentrus adspersus TaxID=1586481 RepID=A0AAV8WBR3_9CUCU|nr:hypothetical protein NQ315_006765 [Exocentrus adspersus]
MKKNIFKVGDKVFAKVKGYPAWPARVVGENGKKYDVAFYGTGETGIIKSEDLCYYLKNKDKFQRSLKRKDYVDAFEQIERAIREDGGDGDEEIQSATAKDSKSNTPVAPSPKAVKRIIKRKRSVSDKSTPDITRKKKYQKTEEEETNAELVKSKSSSKNSPKIPKQESKEIEFIKIDEPVEGAPEEIETVEKPIEKEHEPLDFKIEIVSEKSLKNNIAYAKHVKEKESFYKGKPVEPREDSIGQVFPVKLPSGIMGGIKLHTEFPVKCEFEYDRAVYDETVALRALEEKQKLESGDLSILNNRELFIANIEMSSDDVTEVLYQKDIESKKQRINRLKIESELMSFDAKIKNCLGLDKADPKQAIGYLDCICKIDFDDLMLIKHPHVVEMVRRLRKYVGNTKEWNLSIEALNEFATQAEMIRDKAEQVYEKFKEVVKLPSDNTVTSFWDTFTDLITKFRTECKELTESQIYLLCAQPTSRQTFLNNLEEMESEKENSSGVANAERDVINGGNETPATDS